MKKLAITAAAAILLAGSGAAMAGGIGEGFVAESFLGGLLNNAYASPAIVPAGYPGYYYGPPPYWRYHHWHRWHHHHWRPYYYGYYEGPGYWRWRRHEWREHEWREHEWREHEWRERHWRGWD